MKDGKKERKKERKKKERKWTGINNGNEAKLIARLLENTRNERIKEMKRGNKRKE
jgi:hypothetical protein